LLENSVLNLNVVLIVWVIHILISDSVFKLNSARLTFEALIKIFPFLTVHGGTGSFL
jgi:hypothetical protein